MPTITNQYLGSLRTSATHVSSRNSIITDAPVDNNGKGEAFSPTDLVAGALSACMMTIMGITANNDGIDIDGISSEVVKVMTSSPRKISEIRIVFDWETCTLSPEHREKLKKAALTCPVALSLNPGINQNIVFNF